MSSYLVVSCLLASIAVGSANPPATLSYLPLAAIDKIPNPSYGFNYAVNDPSTGDNKAQWETRNGDVVTGAYSLVEPDGNIRLVEYRADPITGFNAVVKRTGPNVHSFSVPVAPAPVLTKPIISAPIAEVAPIAHVEHVAPIAQFADYDAGPLFAPYAHYADYAPAPIVAPIIEPAPVIAPIPSWNLLPYPVQAPSPWVSLSGASYGSKGKIVRRWAAGPISLDGKTLTIKTKH